MSQGKAKVGIVGSGLIGQSWAMLFASAGYNVMLYDLISENVDKALDVIKDQLKNLESKGLLRGKINAEQQFALIKKASSLSECLNDAVHVQECVFEDIELKRKVFTEMDAIASPDIVLCSSTSFIEPSKFSENLKHRNQVIVGHPVNPPYFVPLVEIIPSKWTDESVTKRTRALFDEIGQKPVLIKKEVNGFALNRVQIAILCECWRLVADDIMSVEDIDTVMSHGLGMRYAFLGPWETAHLNATGLAEYFQKYGQSIHNIALDFGPVPKFEGPVAEQFIKEWNRKIPIDKLHDRRKWRDEKLIELSLLKKRDS